MQDDETNVKLMFFLVHQDDLAVGSSQFPAKENFTAENLIAEVLRKKQMDISPFHPCSGNIFLMACITP